MWIGGWASDLQCWDRLLLDSLPGFDPRFVDAHSVLEGTDRIERLLAGALPGTILVGWSLGGLLVERLVRDGKVPPAMPVALVCSFLDFCDPRGPWNPLVLRRMEKRIHQDASGTLMDFADRLGLSGEERRAWTLQAMELGERSLAEGLRTLHDLRLPGPWAPHPRRIWVESPDDPVAPPSGAPPESVRWMPSGSGHVPFLRHPVEFLEALRGFAT